MNFSDKKMHQCSRLHHSVYVPANAGMTLIELMVAMVIGLILVMGITTLIAQQSSTHRELEKSTRQIENGRYAAQLLRDDIQLAGYYGEFYKPGTGPAALPDPCSTAPVGTDLALAVQGYDSPSTLPTTSCNLVSANFKQNTDILVIRRTDTATIPVAAGVAGQVYLQAGLLPGSPNFTYVIGTGPNAAVFNLTTKDGVTVAPLRKYLVHVYYVSPCNVPATGTSCNGTTDDSGTSVPTLKRLELSVVGGAAQFVSVPLVEGIENLQLDYGIDTTNDGAPDIYKTTPVATDWQNVMSIRVNVLARSNDQTMGYTSSKTYNLGGAGALGPFTDQYKRHVFTELVRVVNPSSRRE